jgi:hypothetical protein
MRKQAVAWAAGLWLISGASVMAGDRHNAPRGDAPERLGEALRSGTADVETIAAVVRWVLEEKEENVAPGLARALHAALDGAGGLGQGREWDNAARGAIDLFTGLLDDARTHRRRDEAELARQAWKLFAPAVTECAR